MIFDFKVEVIAQVKFCLVFNFKHFCMAQHGNFDFALTSSIFAAAPYWKLWFQALQGGRFKTTPPPQSLKWDPKNGLTQMKAIKPIHEATSKWYKLCVFNDKHEWYAIAKIVIILGYKIVKLFVDNHKHNFEIWV